MVKGAATPQRGKILESWSLFLNSLAEGANSGMSREPDPTYRLACLEVRGGNQLALYQAELPGLAGWVSCRPLQPALRGGDLYYMSACSHGVIARVVVADVAGHGETVSAAAVSLREALRKHLDDWDQSLLIRQLNDTFLDSVEAGRYATAFLASYCSTTGELLFTNAGHLPPLWYRSAQREWSLLQDATAFARVVVDLPLGLIAGTPYSQTAIQLEPGDMLFNSVPLAFVIAVETSASTTAFPPVVVQDGARH